MLSATPVLTSENVGYTQVPASNSGNSGTSADCTLIPVTGPGVVTTVSTHVHNISTTQFEAAIYTNVSNAPTNLISNTVTSGNLTNGWNTLILANSYSFDDDFWVFFGYNGYIEHYYGTGGSASAKDGFSNGSSLGTYPNPLNTSWVNSDIHYPMYATVDYATAEIVASPSSTTATVGTPFTVDVAVTDTGEAFNAARATVTKSSNLSITGINPPSTNACNFTYTKSPTVSDPSFAGAILGGSSTGCTVYTMTLTPTTAGTGAITFDSPSIKAYADSSEILTGKVDGSFTLQAAPTPTPTSYVPQLTIDSILPTYATSYTLSGGKDSSISHVFVNSSETGVSFPTNITWQVSKTVSLGDNSFTIYGSDGTNQTATQTVVVKRHTLGDINGDGVIDLIDASLFAIDWDKTENPTYNLSDMNGDEVVDLTDFSILAKLE